MTVDIRAAQSTRPSRPRTIAAICARLSLPTALCAVATLVLMEVLESRWTELDCGDAHTRVLDALVLAALAFAAAALALGVAGLFGRGAAPRWWSVAGIAVALGVATPILIQVGPVGVLDLGSYTCMVSTP